MTNQLALTTKQNVILVYFSLRTVSKDNFRPSKHDDTNIYAESDCSYSLTKYIQL